MPDWTKEQNEAINKDNTNIIVSAGAGSGKTAVLSERVLRKLKQGVDVNELLVLTFTNAAAAEMKIRIRKKIKKANLLDQINKIDSAYITTFDSFALSIVKKYHDVLNISKDLSIVDTSIIELKKVELLNNIFEKKYYSDDKYFLQMINDFCVKDDEQLKKYILNIINQLDMRYDKEIFLNNYIKIYFNNEKIDEFIKQYLDLINQKIKSIKNNLTYLGLSMDNGDKYGEIEEVLEPLLNAKTYEEIRISTNIKLPSLPPKSDETAKNKKTNISNLLKEITKLTQYESVNNIKETILSTKTYLISLIEIINELDEKIKQYKYDNNIYEFVDISKMAIKLVKENEEIRDELKNYFNEIMIDEYQDTNDLQEEFIKCIENNNVYMVGDVKQSIYRFRNANPYIFKEKYEKYSNGIGGYKIDLNKNFRSRDEVLQNINLIFDQVMDDKIGGAKYSLFHRMIFGNESYKLKGLTKHNNDLELYSYNVEKDDKFSKYKKEEIEAFIIANDIKNKIDNKYQVYDKDNEIIKDISYEDIVIIMDRGTNFELYKKIFEYMEIPLTIYQDENILNQNELYIINNLIKLLIHIKENNYDSKFKYSFISIARSYLYELTDDEIFNIVTNNLYNETIIYKDIKEIIEDINKLSLKEIVELLIDKTDIYNKLIKVGHIEESTTIIEKVIDIANNVSKLGYSLKKFSEYLEEIIKGNSEIKYSLNTSTNTGVRIMNIHKSKGLEFHLCYFSGLYKEFNLRELNDQFMYDKEYGIITPYFNEGIGSTIYKTLLKEKTKKEEISERIRLFYVALTRSMEKIILVLPTIEEEDIINDDIVDDEIRNKYNSFLDIIKSIYPKLIKYVKSINLEEITITEDYNNTKLSNLNFDKKEEKLNVEEVNIIDEVLEQESYSKKDNTLIDEETKKKMEYGTYIHSLLEVIDLKSKEINIEVDDYIKTKLLNFMNSDVLKNIENANIYKEYEFIYEEEKIKHHGIIDLMLEYEDHIDIIDYKLKNILDDEYLKQLNGYKKYIELKTKKKTNTYLYSIMDSTLKEI